MLLDVILIFGLFVVKKNQCCIVVLTKMYDILLHTTMPLNLEINNFEARTLLMYMGS